MLADPGPPAAEPDAAEDVELWPQHVDALHLLMALDSDWNMLAVGNRPVYCGINKVAAREVAAWMGLQPGPALLEQLLVLERAALPLRNAN